MSFNYYHIKSWKEIGSYYGIETYKVLRNCFGNYCLYQDRSIYELDDYTFNILSRMIKEHEGKLYFSNCMEQIDRNMYYIGDFNLVCEPEDKYKKIFYLQKDNQKYPITDKENNLYNWYEYTISDLKPNTEYYILGFEKTKYGNIIFSNIKDGGCYSIFVNNKVMNILEKYFEYNTYEDNTCYKGRKNIITCTYNKKRNFPKLTLITGDEIITDNGIKILSQKLCLDLYNNYEKIYGIIGSYTFYINNYKLIDYKKEGRYNFLAMHIYNNNSSYDNNMILGYEFKEKEYYYLKFEEKLILKNIDKDIAKNFEEMKKQDLYTYLLSNNEKRGMSINIDKDHNITYRLVKINDDFFKSKSISTLDISLLKSQIVSEPCEINHFNGEVEDFDYKD